MAAPCSSLSCNSEISQTHCKVQHRVYTPSPSLTLTYTPPPSAKLLRLHCFPAHPLPADLDITSNIPAHPFYSDMDRHVITCDSAAHPLPADLDGCIMSSIMPDMDAHIITSDTSAHRLHTNMDTHISTTHPFYSDMDHHVATSAHIPLHADLEACIMSSIMPDKDAQIIASDMPAHHMDTHISTPINVMGDNEGSQSIDSINDAYESHLFTIWATGFDPGSPHDRTSGNIFPSTQATHNHHSQFNNYHFIELEQLPGLVPDSPTWAASKFTAAEFLGTCAPTSA